MRAAEARATENEPKVTRDAAQSLALDDSIQAHSAVRVPLHAGTAAAAAFEPSGGWRENCEHDSVLPPRFLGAARPPDPESLLGPSASVFRRLVKAISSQFGFSRQQHHIRGGFEFSPNSSEVCDTIAVLGVALASIWSGGQQLAEYRQHGLPFWLGLAS